MKSKLKNYLRTGILLFSTSILLWNCENDSVNETDYNSVNNKTLTINGLIEEDLNSKESLNLFKPLKVNRDNFKTDWKNFTTKTNDSIKLHEFKINFIIPRLLFSEENEETVDYTLLVTEENQGYHYTLIKQLYSKDNASLSFFIKPGTFDGIMYRYNELGELEGMAHYQSGVIKSSITDGAINPKNNLMSRTNCTTNRGIGSKKPVIRNPCGGNGGGWVRQRTDHYTDWYHVTGNSYRYTHTQYNGATYDYIWVNGNRGSLPGINAFDPRLGGSGSVSNFANWFKEQYSNRTSRAEYEKKYRLYIRLTGKAKCVYEKLNLINGNLFKETIGQFIDDPKYDLIFENGNRQSTDDACTNASSIDTTGKITITIEDDKQHGLGIAALILHEGIHAELWRYAAQYRAGINPNDKEEVFRYYKHYAELYGDVFNDNPNNAKSNIDHIYMTQHYIDPIASALRELDNNQYDLDYYKSYAWDGLRAWDPNNTLNIEDDNKYDEYRKIVDENSEICKD